MSLRVPTLMALAVTGVDSRCSISKITSGGGSASDGATGRGNRLSASAFACELVSLNFSVYS